MLISLEDKYKSLFPFNEIDLPDFTVLTGRNGSGKTHFIELFQSSQSNSYPKPKFNIDIHPQDIHLGVLTLNASNYIGPTSWTSWMGALWSEYVSIVHYMDTLEKLYEVNSDLDILVVDQSDLGEMLMQDEVSEWAIKSYHRTVSGKIEDSIDPDTYFAIAGVLLQRRKAIKHSRHVALKSGKSMRQVSQNDFYLYPPKEALLGQQYLFQTGIDTVFYSYAKRRSLNFIKLVANDKLDSKYDCVSDEEFCREKAPWKLINEIFERHKMDYFFEDVSPLEVVHDLPIQFPLLKKSSNAEVQFNDLSSGEKIIMIFILSLFTSEFYGDIVSKPVLYIVDEPDAHLHPELSKLLLDVLNNTFVKELGIKILITTHSPSTVALSPEESIFRIQNGSNTSIYKVSKEDALKELTVGVPTLSIDYKNHRQIFIEGPSDLYYYQQLFDVHTMNVSFLFKPYFISAGDNHLVKSFVNKLREAGNQKAFGILDWDMESQSTSSIVVHGEGMFYSLENSLYNPIYLVQYLMAENGAENVYSELKIPRHTKIDDIGNNSSVADLQRYADWIIAKIEKGIPTIKGGGLDRKEFSFLNEKTILLPAWFLNKNGHDLGKQMKEVFSILKGKLTSEKSMQERFTLIAIRSYPFVPKESVRVLELLCN